MRKLSEHARERLQTVGDPATWARIAEAIEAGRADLFACPGSTYVVTQLQHDTLVVLAAVGVNAEGFFAALMTIARANNLRAVRWHTRRRGLGRLLASFGPVEVERVYEVAL